MIKVLFVCHGNICRSPMAEFILKSMVSDAGLSKNFQIASAATSREEIGNDIYPPAKSNLRLHQIPFTPRGAVQVTARDYDLYDRIYCMDQNNMRNIRRIIPWDPQNKISMLLNRDVADPWYTGDFEKTYNDIVKGCERILSEFQ